MKDIKELLIPTAGRMDLSNVYTDAINNCSIKQAPWYVIPANRKWFRNWAISRIITNTLIEMKIRYPKSSPHHKI
jgi:polyphosphate kinase 2 (PPK2 family)